MYKKGKHLKSLGFISILKLTIGLTIVYSALILLVHVPQAYAATSRTYPDPDIVLQNSSRGCDSDAGHCRSIQTTVAFNGDSGDGVATGLFSPYVTFKVFISSDHSKYSQPNVPIIINNICGDNGGKDFGNTYTQVGVFYTADRGRNLGGKISSIKNNRSNCEGSSMSFDIPKDDFDASEKTRYPDKDIVLVSVCKGVFEAKSDGGYGCHNNSEVGEKNFTVSALGAKVALDDLSNSGGADAYSPAKPGTSSFAITDAAGGTCPNQYPYTHTHVNGQTEGYCASQYPSSDYAFQFTADCAYTGNYIYLKWADADYPDNDSSRKVQPDTSIGWKLYQLDDNGTKIGNPVASMSGSALNGDGGYGVSDAIQLRQNVQYRWEWYNVNRTNGLRLWMPFSEIEQRCDQQPVGNILSVSCTQVHLWAHDPDAWDGDGNPSGRNREVVYHLWHYDTSGRRINDQDGFTSATEDNVAVNVDFKSIAGQTRNFGLSVDDVDPNGINGNSYNVLSYTPTPFVIGRNSQCGGSSAKPTFSVTIDCNAVHIRDLDDADDGNNSITVGVYLNSNAPNTGRSVDKQGNTITTTDASKPPVFHAYGDFDIPIKYPPPGNATGNPTEAASPHAKSWGVIVQAYDDDPATSGSVYPSTANGNAQGTASPANCDPVPSVGFTADCDSVQLKNLIDYDVLWPLNSQHTVNYAVNITPGGLGSGAPTKLITGQGLGDVDIGGYPDMGDKSYYHIQLIVFNLRPDGSPSALGDKYNIIRTIDTGTCHQATCSIAIDSKVTGRPTGVIAGDQFNIHITLTNTGDGALPRSFHGGPLSGTIRNATGWGIGDRGWNSFNDDINDDIPKGQSRSVGGILTAPNDKAHHELRVSPDYFAVGVIGPDCTSDVVTYKDFTLEPHAGFKNFDKENPVDVSYSDGIKNDDSQAVANATASWNVTYTPRGGSAQTLDPGGSDTNTFITRNYDRPTVLVNPRPINAGDTYCSNMTIAPYKGWVGPDGDQVTQVGSKTDSTCPKVVNEPYFRAFNSGVSAGGDFASCSGGGTLGGWFNNKDGAGKGSAAQLSSIALLAITGVASAKDTVSYTASGVAGSGLSLANKEVTPNANTDNDSPHLGGNYPGSFCLQTVSEKPDSTASNDTTVDATSGTSGSTHYKHSVTIGGGQVPIGTNRTIFVEGDVRISGPITYQSGWAVDSVPSFIVHATGNIYIDPSVNEVDGVYIAQGGLISTCSAASGTHSGDYGNCNNQLTVVGALVANKVKMLRTYGSMRNDAGGACSNAGTAADMYGGPASCAAEVFRFSPELYLSKPSVGNGSVKYDSITSLPPVL